MSKKLFFSSVFCMIFGILMGGLFTVLSSHVNQDGILREPWFLVEFGLFFVALGTLLMFVAIVKYLYYYFVQYK
ncbi:DUF3955 domain-containing protein [Staphylococcus equorum]|uniref:DUF3955 domain-containing protein n=1 Tax=Staphylococcus equorum TaxID=246432 RepID=A0A9X4R0M2_9STAP|nr:DUF3955 domain-containing protein [Staphylococcus equorum]MDG0841919.1 DUF3955 domain-containing protein [Staphylococcus equorum]MDG0858029.1 DUF3955 domain-containing protein [Staphylococcus equorum]